MLSGYKGICRESFIFVVSVWNLIAYFLKSDRFCRLLQINAHLQLVELSLTDAHQFPVIRHNIMNSISIVADTGVGAHALPPLTTSSFTLNKLENIILSCFYLIIFVISVYLRMQIVIYQIKYRKNKNNILQGVPKKIKLLLPSVFFFEHIEPPHPSPVELNQPGYHITQVCTIAVIWIRSVLTNLNRIRTNIEKFYLYFFLLNSIIKIERKKIHVYSNIFTLFLLKLNTQDIVGKKRA